MKKYLQIQWTCSNITEAKSIVKELLEKRLIACANIIPNIHSFFIWEDKIDEAEEVKVYMKTVEANYSNVKSFIEKHCSYEVPEIIGISLDQVNEKYAQWLELELKIYGS